MNEKMGIERRSKMSSLPKFYLPSPWLPPSAVNYELASKKNSESSYLETVLVDNLEGGGWKYY